MNRNQNQKTGFLELNTGFCPYLYRTGIEPIQKAIPKKPEIISFPSGKFYPYG